MLRGCLHGKGKCACSMGSQTCDCFNPGSPGNNSSVNVAHGLPEGPGYVLGLLARAEACGTMDTLLLLPALARLKQARVCLHATITS